MSNDRRKSFMKTDNKRPATKEAKSKVKDAELKTGSFVFTDGSKYDGEYKEADGLVYRHGNGKYTSAYTSYTGNWDMDKMSGRGKIDFPSGASYDVSSVDTGFSQKQ
jgi:hypothetical protein